MDENNPTRDLDGNELKLADVTSVVETIFRIE